MACLADMDENFNPNRSVDGSSSAIMDKTFAGGKPGCDGAAVADVEASLIAVLGGMGDGDVAVVGDLVAVRAGPATYHPLKAIKGMASESDVILLSCLPKAPTAGQAAEVVRSVLQRVLVRKPSATSKHIAGPTRGGTAAVAASAGPMPHLRSICPSAHAALVDARLLCAFPISRARVILAGLSPLPAGLPELPTVVAGIVGDASGRCFLGQRAGSVGFSAFSFRRQEVEPDAMLRIEDLIADCGPGTHASARALYDLCEDASDGDVLGGCMREGVNSKPFARLATEWAYSSDTTRTVGSQPPAACSSLLLVGGTCPPSAANAALRGDIEILVKAIARNFATARPTRPEGTRGHFGSGEDGGVLRGVSNDTGGNEQQRTQQWEADLEALLSGSENLAELAARAAFRHGGGENDNSSEQDGVKSRGNDEDTSEQTQNITFEVCTDEGGDLGRRFRGDLDFSELLWELAARASCAEGVRSALSKAFHAVGEGHIFPIIRRENVTAVGRHIREGVAMAREVRYHNTMSVGDSGRGNKVKGNNFGGLGAQQDEANIAAWRERGSAMLDEIQKLAETFMELGVYKVTLDLYHWFEKRAGVLAADIERVLPSATNEKASADQSSTEKGPAKTQNLDPRLNRLNTLAMTRDLVTLAQSYGAPWRQVRSVALSGFARLGRRNRNSGREPGKLQLAGSPLSSAAVFPIGLPKPIPDGARTKLAHPVFWELYLEPAASGGDGRNGAFSATETVSYTMATAGLFQLKGVDEAPVFSVGAARAAQAALEDCPARLVPEVLSCVAGAESIAELTRRQQMSRAKGDAAGDGKAATFVCEHRFMPW